MSNYSIQAKSKIQKENPFRLFYDGFPTAYRMQNLKWNKKILSKNLKKWYTVFSESQKRCISMATISEFLLEYAV